jgi:hypothetical protein
VVRLDTEVPPLDAVCLLPVTEALERVSSLERLAEDRGWTWEPVVVVALDLVDLTEATSAGFSMADGAADGAFTEAERTEDIAECGREGMRSSIPARCWSWPLTDTMTF